MNQNAKLCILRLSAIGDVCHAVALVNRIQHFRPDIQITWIIGKVEYQLVKNLPGIRFVIFDKKAGKQAFKDLKSALKNETFDALFAMQVAFRANLIARIINARQKIGFDWSRSKELHFLFTNKRIATHEHCHVLDGFMDFADAIDIPKLPEVEWNFPVQEVDEKWAEEVLAPFKPFAIINPAASKKERNWSAEGYAQVADYLHAKGFNLILTGGPAESEIKLGEAISGKTPNISTNLIGETSLLQLASLLKRASIVIAPDTGPAHIAAMMGSHVIGLYAHSNPRRTGPYNNMQNTVSVYDEVILKQKGKDWQELPWGIRAKGQNLMNLITVDSVKKKIEKIINNPDN